MPVEELAVVARPCRSGTSPAAPLPCLLPSPPISPNPNSLCPAPSCCAPSRAELDEEKDAVESRPWRRTPSLLLPAPVALLLLLPLLPLSKEKVPPSPSL